MTEDNKKAPDKIEFKSRQVPSSILAGESLQHHADPFGEKARKRVEKTIKNIEKSAAGKRPALEGGTRGEEWLKEQILEMIDKGFLLQESDAYFANKVHKRVMGFNPSSHFLIQQKDALFKELGTDISGVRVVGTGIALKRKAQIENIRDDARINVVLPGDLNALKEMLEIIQTKFDGHNLRQPLVLENPQFGEGKHFYDEILRSIKVLENNLRIGTDPLDQRQYVDLEALAHHYGIYITEQRSETVDIVQKLDKRLPKISAENKLPTVPDGSIVFVATGTMKKYEELSRIFKEQGINVEIRPIFDLVDIYVSADEESQTYEGNVAEKITEALNSWHKMDEKTRVERLAHLGIDKSQVFILGEDSGFHFKEPGIFSEEEFKDIRHKLNLRANQPGVETGPGIFGSNGIINFFDRVRQVFARRDNPDRGVVKKSVLAIAPLEQEGYGDTAMFMVGAEVTGKFTTSPAPNRGAIEIDNFLIPDPIPGLLQSQTEAQLGDSFYLHYSPRALAWKALASEMGIKKGLKKEHSVTKKDDFNVGIVTDENSYASSQQATKLERTARSDGFGVQKIDAKVALARDPQDNVFAKSDSIIFALDPAQAKKEFWRNVYSITSAIVAEQTHDKYVFQKGVYVVNQDGAFDDLKELIYDFHHLGTVPQDPETLVKFVADVDTAVEAAKQDREDYRRSHLPSFATKDEPYAAEGRDSTKDFNVGIFLSATSENEKYLSGTEKLVSALIEEDMGIVTGGGAHGPMGVATRVAKKMRSSHKSHHAASNVPNIMSGEGNVRDTVNQFFLARNIYERMEFMIDKSDSFIVTAGGTGTTQELALLALLKDIAINSDDEYAKDKMEGKEIVIINAQIEHSGVKRGFYDKLLEIIPEEDFERLGIHVVGTVCQAIEKTKELREQKLGKREFESIPQEELGRAVH